MLFITNRSFKEGKGSEEGRKVTFDLSENEPSASVYFCERTKKGGYKELMSSKFFDKLRKAPHKQVLLYIHGFNNMPEDHIFPRAETLQKLCDKKSKNNIQVIPMIWPCDNDLGVIKDYWDDQKAAEASAVGFARVFGIFLGWRDSHEKSNPCYKRINLIAHSMGNRVLRYTLASWANDFGAVPAIFRNIFMAGADIANESLEPGEAGQHIPEAARNVTVYYASDDFALRSSKITNLKNKVVSRRLGHSGPENPEKVGPNVYSVDCDDFNNSYDTPTGHAYFLEDADGKPGSVFKHMYQSMKTGRVLCDEETNSLVLPHPYTPKPKTR